MALEVKYHEKCGKNCTSFLYNGPLESEAESVVHSDGKYPYMKSFDLFCKYVKNEMIEKRNIYYMSRLKAEFVKPVTQVENEDA